MFYPFTVWVFLMTKDFYYNASNTAYPMVQYLLANMPIESVHFAKKLSKKHTINAIFQSFQEKIATARKNGSK